MTSVPLDRAAAKKAGPELLVLARWEEFTGWLLDHTGRWPKSARFTLTQRIENHALDVTEMLVVARYDPRKLDVRKCFDSIEHDVVMETLERIVKDRRVLSLCNTIVRRSGNSGQIGVGLPIGNLTSQWFANLVLGRLG